MDAENVQFNPPARNQGAIGAEDHFGEGVATGDGEDPRSGSGMRHTQRGYVDHFGDGVADGDGDPRAGSGKRHTQRGYRCGSTV